MKSKMSRIVFVVAPVLVLTALRELLSANGVNPFWLLLALLIVCNVAAVLLRPPLFPLRSSRAWAIVIVINAVLLAWGWFYYR